MQVCQAEGIPLEEFAAVEQADVKGLLARFARNIASGDHHETQATMQTWANGIDRIVQHAEASGLDARFPRLALDYFRRGVAAGYGDQEVSALIHVLNAR